jgi:hypothetical protein
MARRTVLATLIVLATGAFVIGTALERNDTHPAERGAPSEHAEGEQAESERAEGASESGAAEHVEASEELKPFGIDVEAAPFVALAAIASLALAFAAWRWPTAIALLALVAVAMAAFAVLDVREVVHQADEDNSGLAVLAAVVALLHLAAAAVAALMIRDAPGRAASASPG